MERPSISCLLLQLFAHFPLFFHALDQIGSALLLSHSRVVEVAAPIAPLIVIYIEIDVVSLSNSMTMRMRMTAHTRRCARGPFIIAHIHMLHCALIKPHQHACQTPASLSFAYHFTLLPASASTPCASLAIYPINRGSTDPGFRRCY